MTGQKATTESPDNVACVCSQTVFGCRINTACSTFVCLNNLKWTQSSFWSRVRLRDQSCTAECMFICLLLLLLQPCVTNCSSTGCPANSTVVDQFSKQVRTAATMSVAYGGNVVGYFRHTFTNCNPQSVLCTGSTYRNQPGVYEVGSHCLTEYSAEQLAAGKLCNGLCLA